MNAREIDDMRYIVAQLRHAYTHVARTNKHLANGLISPQIAKLEKLLHKYERELPALDVLSKGI